MSATHQHVLLDKFRGGACLFGALVLLGCYFGLVDPNADRQELELGASRAAAAGKGGTSGGGGSTSRPSLAVYVTQLGPSGGGEDGAAEDPSLAWAEFLLVSQLYNPDLPFTAVVDRPAQVARGTAAGAALRDAGVTIVPLVRHTRPGSRAQRLLDAAPRIMDQFYRFTQPAHKCGTLRKRDEQACAAAATRALRPLTRFCALADLAAADGAEHVMTLDGGVMLADDVLGTLGELAQRTDVLTLTQRSAHAVVWRRQALDAFCDALLELPTMDDQDMWYVIQAGALPSETELAEQHLLQGFLRVQRPDLSRTLLCGEAAAYPTPDWELCRDLRWKLAVGASLLAARTTDDVTPDQGCDHVRDFLEWRAGGNATAQRGKGSLPELWVKWGQYDLPSKEQQEAGNGVIKPRRHGAPQRAALVHWQGACQLAGWRYVRHHYVTPGLLPVVGPDPDSPPNEKGLPWRRR